MSSREKQEISIFENDIQTARNIIIAIFNRFGDGVIAATVTNEFIQKWRGMDRSFLIVTSPQLLPYVKELCPTVKVIAYKKKNLFYWLRLQYLLRIRYRGFDLGFNPYSYGSESKEIARMAALSKVYTNPQDIMGINYYDRVRKYFGLPQMGDFKNNAQLPNNVKNVLICPDSSEARRTLTDKQLGNIITQVRKKWSAVSITVASGRYLSVHAESRFIFKKSKNNSLEFIGAIKSSDLIISVDSGPLHIAASLKKKVVGLFSSAMPSTVINANADVIALRSEKLDKVYCEVIGCKNPDCMGDLIIDRNSINHWVRSDLRIIEKKSCWFVR